MDTVLTLFPRKNATARRRGTDLSLFWKRGATDSATIWDEVGDVYCWMVILWLRVQRKVVF